MHYQGYVEDYREQGFTVPMSYSINVGSEVGCFYCKLSCVLNRMLHLSLAFFRNSSTAKVIFNRNRLVPLEENYLRIQEQGMSYMNFFPISHPAGLVAGKFNDVQWILKGLHTKALMIPMLFGNRSSLHIAWDFSLPCPPILSLTVMACIFCSLIISCLKAG